MQLSSWGRFPFVEAQVSHPDATPAIQAAVAAGSLIPYGMGRSYGDSALAPRVLMTDRLDLLLGFDEATGVLRAQAGVSLDAILKLFVPRGWFLAVTPGTKFISVGGAIASDVHGKGHHVDGCFSECVLDFRLLLADGSLVTCSREQNAALFRATCGGMGLTGVIVDARFRLQRIRSALFDQVTYKCPDLAAVMERLEQTRQVRYAVAWIDCLARGKAMGRSILTVGDHAPEGPLAPHGDPKLAVPFVAPNWMVSPRTIKAFNALFYAKTLRAESRARVHYDPFFYPLDVARDWNRLYGRAGFTQYQLVLPKAAGYAGMRRVLDRISASGMGSGLAVIKTTGPENTNPLSFPLEGYTLALDFKHQAGLFELLDGLDELVLDLGGRVYLTKDVRLKEKAFKRGYPRWREFQETREKAGAIGRFASLQSKRLGLD